MKQSPETETDPKSKPESKKIYVKPTIVSVQLIVEQSVLSLCKYGDASPCGLDLSCSSTPRS